MKGIDRGGGGFNVIRVCIGIMMLHALVEGVNLEAWEKIYDHWDLGTKVFPSECRSDPCGESCGNGEGSSVQCTYSGVYCNITRLNLEGIILPGSIPAELFELKALRYLDLNYNQLNGSIPAEFGKLKALTYLRLLGNQLTGSIPAELGELKALTELYLQYNQLTGSIPAELGELKALTYLWLDTNQLTGSIPAELGELKALTDIDLSNNQLTPPAPPSVIALCNNLGTVSCRGFNPKSIYKPVCSAFINDKC